VGAVSISLGTEIGPYKIDRLLGKGGMGEVYHARDDRLGRVVAIKVIPAIFAADRERLRRFEQEARAAAALNRTTCSSREKIGSRFWISVSTPGQRTPDD
jgi:serine/threonine protein kinase